MSLLSKLVAPAIRLKDNMNPNGRRSVQIFDRAANRHTLKRIIESHEDKIDFLKADCEACEYELLLHCHAEVLARGEIHRSRNPREATLFEDRLN